MEIVRTAQGINAYAGHLNKATTVLDYYYHQDENWAGLRLAQLSGAGPKIVPVPEDTREMLKNDDADAAEEDGDETGSGPKAREWPFGLRSSAAGLLTRLDGGEENKEAENADPRAKATEVVASGPTSPRRRGLVLYRAIGPSTTLAESGLTSSYKIRKFRGGHQRGLPL
jgi:hypothetical protein